jgi:peptidyl-prolyl cis-trans isomerase B (cyclophilin B)
MTQTVELQTNHGAIRIELDDAKAPLSAANFIAYVNAGHYDGTIFHRVIKGFMVQGGGFDETMKQKPTNSGAVVSQTNCCRNS